MHLAAARQARSLEETEHRPWPLPARRWTLGQTWEDLLFAHWRVPAEELRRHVPEALEVDQHGGSSWLGIVPFRLTALRLRGTLPPPLLSSFYELNVRTYVRTTDGKPGIWFFSLDASSTLAAAAARRLYALPYFPARFAWMRRGSWIEVECARLGERARVFSGRYRPHGAVFLAEPGSLELFLAERYCLYTTDARGVLYRADIHHRPWPLQEADAEISLTTVAPFELAGEPLCHFSRRQDALVWTREPVG